MRHDTPKPTFFRGKIRWAVYLAIFLGPVVAVGGVVRYYDDKDLLATGTRAEGRIEGAGRISNPRGSDVYEMDVAFSDPASNRNYRKRFSMSAMRFPIGVPKDTVTVVFAPEDPARSVLGDDFTPNEEPIVIGVGVSVIGVIGLFIMRAVSRRNVRLLEQELPAPAWQEDFPNPKDNDAR